MPDGILQRGGSQTPLQRSDYYDKIRSQIDAENELSNMRVIWLLIAEAFFVGGYATLLNAQDKAKNAVFGAQQDLLFWIVPIAALLAGLLALAGVVASTRRVQQFEQYYEAYQSRTQHDLSTEGYPPLQEGRPIHWLTRLSIQGLPILFIVLWTVILISQCVNAWF
jgi:hypothetical protein